MKEFCKGGSSGFVVGCIIIAFEEEEIF